MWRLLGVPSAGCARELSAAGVPDFERCYSGADRERLAMRYYEERTLCYTDVASITLVCLSKRLLTSSLIFPETTFAKYLKLKGMCCLDIHYLRSMISGQQLNEVNQPSAQFGQSYFAKS